MGVERQEPYSAGEGHIAECLNLNSAGAAPFCKCVTLISGFIDFNV